MMPLFKNLCFWVLTGIVAAVSAYMIRSASAVGFMICYLLTPTAFGLAVRTYLDQCNFADALMDAAWRPNTEAVAVTEDSIVRWS